MSKLAVTLLLVAVLLIAAADSVRVALRARAAAKADALDPNGPTDDFTTPAAGGAATPGSASGAAAGDGAQTQLAPEVRA